MTYTQCLQRGCSFAAFESESPANCPVCGNPLLITPATDPAPSPDAPSAQQSQAPDDGLSLMSALAHKLKEIL